MQGPQALANIVAPAVWKVPDEAHKTEVAIVTTETIRGANV